MGEGYCGACNSIPCRCEEINRRLGAIFGGRPKPAPDPVMASLVELFNWMRSEVVPVPPHVHEMLVRAHGVITAAGVCPDCGGWRTDRNCGNKGVKHG